MRRPAVILVRPAPKAERTAPAFHPHEKQIGHVCTGHEQNDDYGAHQNPEDVADVADDVVLESVEIGANFGRLKDSGRESIGRGKAVDGDRQETIDVGVGLGERDARFHPGDATVAEVAEFDLAAIKLHGEEDRVGP